MSCRRIPVAVEMVQLVGGPLDGQKRESHGGNILQLPGFYNNRFRHLLYRRAHEESKFFSFLDI